MRGGEQWEVVRKWCLVAGQAGTNGKTAVNLETMPVTIDDEEFDRWMTTHLVITFGHRPSASTGLSAGAAGPPPKGLNYVALSRILVTMIGVNVLQFSQAAVPTAGAGGASGGEMALAIGKGFKPDQLAKLKDACGFSTTQQILAIWQVIQAMKGKSFNTYRNNIAKAIDTWSRQTHIAGDKAVFLEAKFFGDLVALRFNPGGPVAQLSLVAQGMSLLACRLLSAVEAEYCCKYEEAAANTKHTRSLDDLLKQNCGKAVVPGADYIELKLNIGTYCGLLWAIFEDHCNY